MIVKNILPTSSLEDKALIIDIVSKLSTVKSIEIADIPNKSSKLLIIDLKEEISNSEILSIGILIGGLSSGY